MTTNLNALSVKETWNSGVYLGLPPQINADTSQIYKNLEENSIINNRKRPVARSSLLMSDPYLIISYYNSVAYGLLSYFRCSDNLNTIKKIVTYHLRYSLLHTLAKKHKSSISKILESYGKQISFKSPNGHDISFINSVEVTNINKEYLVKSVKDPYSKIHRTYLSLQNAAISRHECAIKDCVENTNIEVHHVRKLFRNTYNGITVVKGKGVKLKGIQAIESALKRKQVPLCNKHHIA